MNLKIWKLVLLLSAAFSLWGCDLTIESITVPPAAVQGQTIMVTLRGYGCNDANYSSPNGLILQIPIGAQVVGTDGLTPDNDITSGYTAEPGYQLWGGTESYYYPEAGCMDVTRNIKLKINDAVTPGSYSIKAAVGGFVQGVWTPQRPESTDFTEISGSYQSNTMVISDTGIGVMSPNGLELWYSGRTQTIEWVYRGDVGSAVNIELYKGSIFFGTVADNIAVGSNGNGLFDWAIPADLAEGNDYQVKITSTSNNSYSDLSDTFFSIHTPEISLIDPNGSSLTPVVKVYNGIVEPVWWGYDGLDGTTINIDLYKEGIFHSSVAANVPVAAGGYGPGYGPNGTYEWLPSAEVGTDYQIKITSNLNSIYSDVGGFITIDNCPFLKVCGYICPSCYSSACLGSSFNSLQEDYTLAPNGKTLYVQATDFAGGITFDQNKTTTLLGGYSCDYYKLVGHTIIEGPVTIVRGSVRLDLITIR